MLRGVIGAVALLSFACADTGDLEERVEALDGRLNAIEEAQSEAAERMAALESAPAAPAGPAGPAAIVVQSVNAPSSACNPNESSAGVNTWAVRYVIAGLQQGLCVHPNSSCASSARIGARLPESCGGAP